MAVTAALVTLTGCGRPAKPPTIDAELASCVPTGTLVVAGINLDQIRATPLYQTLLAEFQSLRDTSYLIVAYNGREATFLGRGKYPDAPAGATLVARNLVVSGSPESVRAVIAQHQSGVSGAGRLLGLAGGIAGSPPVWMVAQGGVSLPLSGNAENLNRILRLTQYVTLGVQIGSQIRAEAAAVGRNDAAGRQLEESLRAILTFAAAAGERRPEVEAALKSIAIRRDGLIVYATLATTTDSLLALMREFGGS